MNDGRQHRIVVGRVADGTLDRSELEDMYRLRFEVFHQRLGWHVNANGREERDAYDLEDPYYMVARDEQGAMGCWRLLPTTGRYMLRDTFSGLLRGELAPCSDSIWELSRFAVTSPSQHDQGQVYLSDLTLEMISHLIRFADQRAISDYVTVTSASVERLMVRVGIPMIRFGDGQSMLIDDIESVACWIPVNRQFREAVARNAPLGASCQVPALKTE